MVCLFAGGDTKISQPVIKTQTNFKTYAINQQGSAEMQFISYSLTIISIIKCHRFGQSYFLTSTLQLNYAAM